MPDLILLDLKLPKINGHEILAKIKNDSYLKKIPVIVLTTSSTKNDIEQAYMHYANSYLVKPTALGCFKKMAAEIINYWGYWNKTALEMSEKTEPC